jgi:excisionase family DNA binding protein
MNSTTHDALEKRYLTKAEAAAYLRLSLRSIDNLLARKELVAYRIARKLLFTREDLDALVRERGAEQCNS